MVAEVLEGEHLLVMMEANARTGRRALAEGGKDVSMTRCWVHTGRIS